MRLWSGNLALNNIVLLNADDDLACDDLLIGLAVPRLLEVETGTLLKHNWDSLDEANCAQTKTKLTTEDAYASRLMPCRLHGVSNLNNDPQPVIIFALATKTSQFMTHS